MSTPHRCSCHLSDGCYQNARSHSKRVCRSGIKCIYPIKFWRLQMSKSWWRHQMEAFSALLAVCAGNSPVAGDFPAQRPVTRSFDVFLDLRLNKRLRKQLWGRWFESLSCPLWRHCNVRFVLNDSMAHCSCNTAYLIATITGVSRQVYCEEIWYMRLSKLESDNTAIIVVPWPFTIMYMKISRSVYIRIKPEVKWKPVHGNC